MIQHVNLQAAWLAALDIVRSLRTGADHTPHLPALGKALAIDRIAPADRPATLAPYLKAFLDVYQLLTAVDNATPKEQVLALLREAIEGTIKAHGDKEYNAEHAALVLNSE